MTYQLKIGRKIEREHLPYFRKIQAYKKKTGKCPTEKQFVEGIAKAHLKEDKNYYTKLKKARL
jgi:hypothetical protein